MQEEICCPKFDPTPWDKKEFAWKNKKFIKEKVFTFIYIPIGFGSAMTRSIKKIADAGANMQDSMALSDHTSKWNMDLYFAVDKEVPGAENITLSGKFVSKVYDGDFKDTAAWGEDFKKYVKEKGYEIKKWYMWYTTCPKCAKKYGHNYVVTIAEVK